MMISVHLGLKYLETYKAMSLIILLSINNEMNVSTSVPYTRIIQIQGHIISEYFLHFDYHIQNDNSFMYMYITSYVEDKCCVKVSRSTQLCCSDFIFQCIILHGIFEIFCLMYFYYYYCHVFDIQITDC